MASIILSGCRGRYVSRSNSESIAADSAANFRADYSADEEAWADSIYRCMSVAERAGMILMPGIYSSADAANLSLLKRYVTEMHVGGIVLLKGTPADVSVMTDSIRRWSSLPLFVAIDAEWGLAMRLKGAASYPVFSRLGEVEENYMYDYGHRLAAEASRLGINMILGPVLDVAGDDASYISFRTLGSDPARVASLGVAYARGLEDGGVLSCAKHFPGHGSVSADSHKSLPVIRKSLEQLEGSDLLPFKRYISEGNSAVMVGHLALPSVDSSGRSASASPEVIGSLLRERMGFRGLVLTDAISMAGASGESAREAIAAGADMVLAPLDTQKELSWLIQMSPDSLERAVKRILRYKYRFK